MRHVCNVDTNFIVAVGKCTDMEGIVNVGAAWRINAANFKMPQIAPARQILLGGFPIGRW